MTDATAANPQSGSPQPLANPQAGTTAAAAPSAPPSSPPAAPPANAPDPVLEAYRAWAAAPTDGAKINALQEALKAAGTFNPRDVRGGKTTQYFGNVTTDAMERYTDAHPEIQGEVQNITRSVLMSPSNMTAAETNPAMARAIDGGLYINNSFGEKNSRSDARAILDGKVTDAATKGALTKFDADLAPPPADPSSAAPAGDAPPPAAPRKTIILDLSAERSTFGRDGDVEYLKGLETRLREMGFDVKVAENKEDAERLRRDNAGASVFRVKEDGLHGAAKDGLSATFNDTSHNVVNITIDANNQGNHRGSDAQLDSSARVIAGYANGTITRESDFSANDLKAPPAASVGATPAAPAAVK